MYVKIAFLIVTNKFKILFLDCTTRKIRVIDRPTRGANKTAKSLSFNFFQIARLEEIERLSSEARDRDQIQARNGHIFSLKSF